MAHSRFIRDTGLTVRMTTVMFLLGAAFVALVVALMYIFPAYWWFFGLLGIGVAFYQWWSSDTLAMKAMRAREVTPEEAPELHGMIDRLCAMADMPKPRVGVADLDIPNAFATGRSPDRAVVCVTTGAPHLRLTDVAVGDLNMDGYAEIITPLRVHPSGPTDSRLRRLVVDRNYLE